MTALRAHARRVLRRTEGRSSADALRARAESDERYRSLFAYNPHAAFFLDLEGRYLDANDVGAELAGYSLAELREMDFGQVICPEDLPRVGAAFQDVVARQPRQVDARMRHRDGRIMDLRITAVPVVVDDEVVGVHGIAENVTEANRMRRELEEARRVAERANAAKSLFLANMSHEVRTPLTSVLAANELLEDLELGGPADGLIQMIDRSGKRLLRLVNDLLDFSQLERSALEVVQGRFELRFLVAETVEEVTPVAEHKGLDLHWSVAEEVPDVLYGDPVRIAQVLTNLLDNAVKFTDSGRVSLRVSLEATVGGGASVTPRVRFDVVDPGVGIPADQVAHLFESFTQADASATRAHDGAGLGLAICRELVDLMHGELAVTSAPGAGSIFSVLLPLTAD